MDVKSVDPPSNSPMPAAAQPSKHSSSPKLPHSAKSPSVRQEDHIYTEVVKSCKKSAKSPPAGLTHSTNSTHVHEVDELREVDVTDITTQSESITSSTIGVGAVPTQEVAVGNAYTEVDYSKKKSRRGKKC